MRGSRTHTAPCRRHSFVRVPFDLSWIVIAFVLLVAGSRANAAERRVPESLDTILQRYQHAIAESGAGKLTRFEAEGTVSGAGLTGLYHEWAVDDRHRTDANLGPRNQRTLQIGNRFYYLDENNISRELTGVLARRARTQALIDSGDFADQPEHCKLEKPDYVNDETVDVVDVTAPGGDTETVDLSPVTGLPVRVEFDDDDARTSVTLSDWRVVGGHKFPYRSVTSDGDKAFDTVQTTQTIVVNQPIDAAVFAPVATRTIDMAGGPMTVPITVREGHCYVSATIDGHPYTFLLDSGSQNIVLDKHVADELKLATYGDLEASGTKRTGGLQLAVVTEFDIARGKLHNLIATAIDLHGTTAGAFAIDGILGYPFFAEALVKIDVAGRTMTFGPPGSFAPSGEKIALDVDRAIPEASFRLNKGVDAPFIVDTGNAAEVLLYKPFVDRHAGIVPYTQTTRNSYGIGGITGSYRTTLDELDIGSIAMYHAETDVMQATRGAFADKTDAGNVGLGVLQNFVLTFDLTNNALYVDKSSAFDDGRSRI